MAPTSLPDNVAYSYGNNSEAARVVRYEYDQSPRCSDVESCVECTIADTDGSCVYCADTQSCIKSTVSCNKGSNGLLCFYFDFCTHLSNRPLRSADAIPMRWSLCANKVASIVGIIDRSVVAASTIERNDAIVVDAADERVDDAKQQHGGLRRIERQQRQLCCRHRRGKRRVARCRVRRLIFLVIRLLTRSLSGC